MVSTEPPQLCIQTCGRIPGTESGKLQSNRLPPWKRIFYQCRRNGKCVDTTMGLTPLEGVVMGTRSGNIDPAIMEFIAKKENLDIAGVMNVLNKKSGLYGMSGVCQVTSVT